FRSQPIEGAVVISMEPLDSVMVQFGSTDEQGHFKLGKFRKDSLLIQVSFLGFAPFYQTITCKGEDINLQVKMQSEEMLLQTVVVKEERIPIKMNGDTVQYDARAFRVKTGDVTEDLLKKMPGIEVDDQGNVRAMGKSVSKVLVDGKEFFGSDPKMATKNIPADAVKKVKVFDKKTENETFTKTDDGEENITIDLELKEDKKVGGFGRLTATGGTRERYAAKGNYFRFAPKIKYSLIGMSNNTNQTGYSIDDMISFKGGMSALQNGGFMIDDALPFSGNDVDGLWQTHSGAGSFSYNGNQLELNTTLSALNQNSISNSEKETEQFFNLNEKFFLNNDSKGTSNSGKYLGKVSLKYEIDTTQQISLKGKMISDFRKNLNDSKEWRQNEIHQLVSQNKYSLDKINVSLPWSGSLTYRKRFKNGHTIIGLTEYSKNESIDDQSIDDQSTFYDPDTTYVSVYREINRDVLSRKDKQRLEYTLPSFKENRLKIWGSREGFLDKENLDNKIFDGTGFSKIDSLSGDYERDVERLQVGMLQDMKIGKLKLGVGLSYEQSSLGGAVGDEIIDEKKYSLFKPYLKWGLKITGSSFVRFTYRASQNLPSLKEILPIVEVHSASYTYRGNPSLQPARNHRFSLTYRNFDRFSGRSFYGSLNFSYYRNPVIYARSIDAGYRQIVTPMNVPKKSILTGYAFYQMKIPFLKAKIKLNTQGNLMHGTTILNDELLSSIYKTYSMGIGISNSKKKIYDFGIDAMVRGNVTETNAQSATTVSYSYSGYFSVTMPKGFEFDTNGAIWYYPNTRFDAFPRPRMNWTLSKTFTESKKWLIGLSGYDMFGRNDGYKQSAGPDQVSTTRTERVGRYFLLKVSYKI
ncbi:MAG TPA: hypothetical protein ENK85_00850, partial [Saprospiraceae bacterium]|nr:hypothetical protein [Saprospiraceae bacterium]